MTKSATRIQDKDSQRRLSVVQSTEDPTKYGVVILNPDGSKIRGPKGEAATVTVGTTTTGQPGTNASVTNSGTTSDAVLNFTIPRGDKGEIGTAATIAVGTTTTGQAGSSASVTNSGTSSAAVFNFVIPKGDKGNTGDAATITVGNTTTGQPGTDASVVNSGTSGAAVLDFTIPQGIQGEQGETGNGIQSVTSSKSGKITTVTVNYTDGSTPYSFQVSDGLDGEGSGDVLGPNSSTDGHFALFDGTSGKLIKNGGAIVDALNSSSTTDALSANQGKAINDSIGTINGKISAAASTSNQLADKNYVDTAINSVAAYYLTKNAAGDQFATYAELAAATTFYAGGVVRVPTRNDYCIVADDENHDHATTRYIYNTNWEYQYTVNETALTSDQIAALNSGITAGLVTTYNGYASQISGKQDALTQGSNISITTSGGVTTISATDTTYSDATQSTAGLMSSTDKAKLDGIASGAQVNSITGVKGNAESTYRTGNVNITPANIGVATQTAYTSKGTSTKVPTITTNTLGQVTGITETSIAFPVTSVNGDTGAVTVNPGITKVFTLPADLTTAEALAVAQEAYDWYIAGNVSVLKKGSAYSYVVRTESSGSKLAFYQGRISLGDNSSAGVTDLFSPKVSLSISGGAVTEITTAAPSLKSVLATGVDYSTPYTPEYDGSPATKKYVDDHGVPTVGSNGQVLTVVSGEAAWANAPVSGIQCDPNSPITITKIRCGTESQYSNLGTYDSSTAYMTV